ncbi:alpha-crystallin B chain-like [Oppia nitens]|uniref:alpha-crystallin B chain-like n=1 Tax=Oppia nitens TaxID=1686743 RepID=UPI0023DB6419|nr:alpha-crystallin B chain-like [Oppia nitens]
MSLDLFLANHPFLNRRYRDRYDWPRSLFGQHFGLDLQDFDDVLNRSMNRINESTDSSQVANTADKFSVNLDVSHFKPEEIEVKTVGNCVQIHGKHEERCDSHGWVSREFTRRYALPDGCKPEDVVSSLKPNGVLTIVANKQQLPLLMGKERVVPIAINGSNDK